LSCSDRDTDSVHNVETLKGARNCGRCIVEHPDEEAESAEVKDRDGGFLKFWRNSEPSVHGQGCDEDEDRCR
jgi:hypothetical protein